MIEEFYANVYGSASVWTMWLATKKAKLTDKAVHLWVAGPKHWHLMLALFIGFIIFPVILIWLIAAQFSKGKEIVISFKNISKVEVDHPKFTFIHRIKITEKNGKEHYFIPRKSYWELTANKEFVHEFCKKVKKVI